MFCDPGAASACLSVCDIVLRFLRFENHTTFQKKSKHFFQNYFISLPMCNFFTKKPELFTKATNKEQIERNSSDNRRNQRILGLEALRIAYLYEETDCKIRHIVGIDACNCDGFVIQYTIIDGFGCGRAMDMPPI